MKSLSIYHGDEDWILKGLGIDLHKAFESNYPDLAIQRFDSFTDFVGDTEFHFFVQQGQLNSFVKTNGESLLGKTICLFTHFNIKEFPCKILNKCLGIMFMSSSQLSVAVANGLDSSRAFLCPLGVDQSLHRIYDKQEISSLEFGSVLSKKIKPFSAVGFVTRFWDKPAYTGRKRYDIISKVASILASLDLPVLILGPGWQNYTERPRGKNIFYCTTKYSNYPIIYNFMKVFCSLSLHEGGPMPLLESMSCGVKPVVTNTGFAYDVLGNNHHDCLISTDSSAAKIVASILKSYFSDYSREDFRKSAQSFSFSNAARTIVDWTA